MLETRFFFTLSFSPGASANPGYAVDKAYAHLGHVADSNAPTGLGFRKAKKCQDYSLKNHEETYVVHEY